MTEPDILPPLRPPSGDRPLEGLTILLVEDSRFAAEGIRLMCRRSGARLRRADCLSAARRHLCVYRPSVVIVDMGLPDGSGARLISDLARASPRVEALFGTSADPDAEIAVLSAGADGFIPKPLESLAAFQSAVLARLPAERQPSGPRQLPDDTVEAGAEAYRDDLASAWEGFVEGEDAEQIGYLTQFLAGVARSAGDTALTDAVGRLAAATASGAPLGSDMAQVESLVKARLHPSGRRDAAVDGG